MIRIALITQHNFSCCDLFMPLQKYIKTDGHDMSVERICVEDIIISWENGHVHLTHNDKDIIVSFSTFIFRLNSKELSEKAYFIGRTLKRHEKFLVNESYGFDNTYSDKLSVLNTLQDLKLYHPRSTAVSHPGNLEIATKHFSLPFIVKDIHGWQGDTVKLINNQKQIAGLRESFPKDGLLIQEYLPIQNDIRVLVIGYNAIGAISRTAPEGDFRTNLSVGGSARKVPLTKSLKTISETIAKKTKNAFLGVDFILHNEKLYVLEIENTPGINGFKKATSISPIANLLAYISQSR